MYVLYDGNDGEVIGYQSEDKDKPPEIETDSINQKVATLPETDIVDATLGGKDGLYVDDIHNPSKVIRDIEKTRQQRKQEIRQEAFQKLSDTDWYVVREQETGESIPTEIKEYRSSVRSEEDRCATAIDNATTVDGVTAVTPNWPDEP